MKHTAKTRVLQFWVVRDSFHEGFTRLCIFHDRFQDGVVGIKLCAILESLYEGGNMVQIGLLGLSIVTTREIV